MFEVGFSEIMVVLVVALLVIGPNKLPSVARQIGFWVGRTRAYISSVKGDIDRELRLQELQNMIKQNDVHDIIEETKSSLTIPTDDKPIASKAKEDVLVSKEDEKNSLESKEKA